MKTRIIAAALTFFLSGLEFVTVGFASGPAQMIILRHAEKPEDGNELSEEGFKRAEQLVDFFSNDPRVLRFGNPVGLYAQAPKSKKGSLRSIQTLQPTADKLSIPLSSDYERDEYADLLKSLKKDSSLSGKTVVICWEHKVIMDMLDELGISSPPAPKKWPKSVFDWAFLVDFDSRGKVSGFKQISQNLPMDREEER